MHAASHIIAKLIEGCIWFVNKFGINGFLVILLVIEIPVVYVASDSIGSGYRGARNYKIKNVDVRPADEETVRQNCPDMDYDEENHYYLVKRCDMLCFMPKIRRGITLFLNMFHIMIRQ